jgi:hypothetical protein
MDLKDEQLLSSKNKSTNTSDAQPSKPVVEHENRLAPFNPTSDQVQETALNILALKKDDVLFDLGCGDARLLVTAAQQMEGLRCVGIEMDPIFASRAKERVRKLSSDETRKRIEIREGDVLELGYASVMQPVGTDEGDIGELCRSVTFLNDASALYLFLVPNGLKKIKPLLDRVVEIRKEQKRSFSVVAYMFQIPEWEPILVDRSSKADVPLYLYRFEAQSD